MNTRDRIKTASSIAAVAMAIAVLTTTSAALTLEVNTITGETTLLGDATRDIDINFYEITSELDSLDDAGWSSLADQDFEGNGAPDNKGNGWEEAGGVGKHALAEGWLLGNSTIGAATLVGLGTGYDTGVDERDLMFEYRTGAGVFVEGLVVYETGLDGDWDGDLDVDDVDLNLLLSNYEADGPGGGDVSFNSTDLDILLANFGRSYSAALSHTAPVPEPASLVLMLFGAIGLLIPRRLGSGRE